MMRENRIAVLVFPCVFFNLNYNIILFLLGYFDFVLIQQCTLQGN
jgi:hypothetical protein